MPARALALPARLTPASARKYVQAWLRAEHTALAEAFDSRDLPGEAVALRERIGTAVARLEAHALVEEQCLYPAVEAWARTLVDEAHAEHAAMGGLLTSLKDTTLDERRAVARFKVLGEYLRHHVAEEEGALFPAIESAPVAWVELARALPAPAPPAAARRTASKR